MTLTSLVRSALPAMVVSLTVGVSPAFAGDPPEFVYIQLGTLGGADSVGYGLNASQQVVGWSSIPGCVTANGLPCRRAYLWEAGVMTNLGMLAGDEDSFARAINDAGLVAGTSESDILFGSGTFSAVTWSAGTITALPDLGSASSIAHDVNESGTVAGWARDPNANQDRAVTWSGGAINNVGASETHQSNRLVGLNDLGDLVGFAWNLFQPNDAVLFDGVKWEDIGGIDGPFQNAEAKDVNNTGTTVGLQAFPSGAWHAALWVLGVGAIDAGVLPGMNYAELYDVNDAGLAVGRSYDDGTGDSRAAYWDGNTLHDLNDLLAAGVSAQLFEAREINENGDIAGTALVDGSFRAFLLLADPEVGTWDDLGNALAGSFGNPALAGSGALIGGSENTIALSNAQPGATAHLIAGFGQLNAPFKFGVMVPTPDLIFSAQIVNGAGEITLSTTWPSGVPSGFEFYTQYWIQDAGGPVGWAASNGLRATTP